MDAPVALITGGFRGLGRGIAQVLSARGITTIVTSRGAAPGLSRSASTEPWLTHLDVTREASVSACIESALAQLGRIDIWINNAGVGVFKPALDTSTAEWEAVLATNLTGAFTCCRHAGRVMAERGGGRIVNIGSVADQRALPHNAAYAASKWGLRGLSAVLAEEWQSLGVRVSHVSLGAVYTEMWQGRPGFDPSDMIPLDVASAAIADLALLPLSVRADNLVLLPPKGVL